MTKYFIGKLIIEFIIFFKAFTKTLVPLSFTIYFFSYKEQKDVAISLFKKKRSFISLFYMFLIGTILVLLISIYLTPNIKEPINAKNLLISLIYITWISLAILSYKKLLNSINIQKTFDHSLKKINKSFNKIKKNKDIYDSEGMKKKERILKNVCKEVESLSLNAEVLIQMLLSKKKYNLTNDFSNSLLLLETHLFSEISEINNNPSFFSFIVPFSKKEYSKLYSIAQQGVIELMTTALSTGNPKDIELLINSFAKLKTNEFTINEETDISRFWRNNTQSKINLETYFKQMYDSYYLSTFRIINQLYKNNNNGGISILRNIIKSDQQSEIYSKENDLLSLISSLMMDAIENDDLKKLTDISNILFDYIKGKPKKVLSSKHKLTNKIIKMNKIENKIQNKSVSAKEKKAFKFSFFSIVKSIELGRYKCAGFLIKNTVSNFEQKNFSIEVNQIKPTARYIEPQLGLSKNLTRLLPLKFVFSTSSFEYCLLKAKLLIYYQQKFVDEMNLNNISFEDMIKINTSVTNGVDYSTYLDHKIEGLNKEYGLIFLEKNQFKKIRLTKSPDEN